ncbi:hypothetical protein AAON49_14090 [Pseudotenacibaculum sp. MALMAid0570]|uniref:hypothetical protein n=1 Tax=Pseudotenacibaculum sp. MALMAid0570 TaxID=3143938 RepID=UPI0032DE44BF
MRRIANLYILSILIFCLGCKAEKNDNKNPEIMVFNIANETSRANFQKLKLDDTHSNLLNPSISKDSMKFVYKSWSELHTNMSGFLNKKDFDWGISDEKIKIFNKIYFHKNGNVKAYAYRIYNPITNKKGEEYGKLIEEFLKSTQISISKDKDFAQCGKVSLPNTIKNQEI